ncbi:MAG: oligosaccharide flippase family protein [Lutibacter sp.]|uniref:oligosaccharide flippase family protein n=1 Tax=Lutibacter sp. TaxID=1925666 RepID=UPI00385C24E8
MLMFRGTILSQILGFVGSIFLAKIYGSEAYGVFGVFLSISSILMIINTLQLENGVITAKTEDESKNLMNSLFIISFFLALIIFLSYNFITYLLNFSDSYSAIVNISIAASIALSYNKIHESFLTFRKKFKPISTKKILTVVFNILFQLILFLKFKLMGLVYGATISSILVCIYYFQKNLKYLKPIKFKALKENVLQHKSIIKFILPSTLINSLAVNLIPILIVTFFSLKDSGVYTLSLKIVATPLFLISSSISQVYYQKSAKIFQYSKEKLYDLTKKIVFANVGLMLLFLIVINTIGIYLLEFLLPKNWENLRLFIGILSFLILARSSFNPISNIIIVLNKNKISLLFNLYLLCVNLLGIYIGFLTNNLIYTLTIISIFGGFGYLVLLLYFLKTLKSFKRSYEKNILTS